MTGIEVDLGSVTLTVDEVWPDGDAPEHPTAEDVAAIIRRAGRRWVQDWSMEPQATVTVWESNPHWSPSPALLPDLTPDPIVAVTTAVV